MFDSDGHFIDDPLLVVTTKPDFSNLGLEPIHKNKESMQSFDKLLREELARPATMKGGGTIKPMEAMVKSVVNNAMKGDLASIAFIRNMTKEADPESERQAREHHKALVDDVQDEIVRKLDGEGLFDGQYTEVRMVAEIKVFTDELTQMMTAPDFQAVSTDMKTGHQTVSPIIALRDKQRDLFQQQLAKLRQEAMQRKITRKQLSI
jgi:hypothetical protein